MLVDAERIAKCAGSDVVHCDMSDRCRASVELLGESVS